MKKNTSREQTRAVSDSCQCYVLPCYLPDNVQVNIENFIHFGLHRPTTFIHYSTKTPVASAPHSKRLFSTRLNIAPINLFINTTP